MPTRRHLACTGLASAALLLTTAGACGSVPDRQAAGTASGGTVGSSQATTASSPSASATPPAGPVVLEANVDDGKKKVEVDTLVSVTATKGTLSKVKVSPDGRVVSEAEWNACAGQWLPSNEDRAYVASLMGRVIESGKFANWIAPPVMGINRQPVDFDYVRFN